MLQTNLVGKIVEETNLVGKIVEETNLVGRIVEDESRLKTDLGCRDGFRLKNS